MPNGRQFGHKDAVAACALAGAALFGTWLWLRSHSAFGPSWSDGARTYTSQTGAGVRHAVWDEPTRLTGITGEGSDPTLSLDGRWLVFSAGQRGLNSELYIAERGAD